MIINLEIKENIKSGLFSLNNEFLKDGNEI